MTNTKTEIHGIPVDIVSDEEAENVDYVVCMPWGPSRFDDNLKGVCSKCGIDVMYRWHAPRKPAKICLNCALKAADNDTQS